MNTIDYAHNIIKSILFVCALLLSAFSWTVDMTICTDTQQTSPSLDSVSLLNEVIQTMGQNKNLSNISWNIGQSNNQPASDTRFFFPQLPGVGKCQNIRLNLSKSTSKEDEEIEVDKLIKAGGLILSLRDSRAEGGISKEIVLPYTAKFMLNYCRIYINYTYTSTSKLIANIGFEIWENSGNFNIIEITPQCCISPSPIPVSQWGTAPDNFRGGQDCPIKKPV